MSNFAPDHLLLLLQLGLVQVLQTEFLLVLLVHVMLIHKRSPPSRATPSFMSEVILHEHALRHEHAFLYMHAYLHERSPLFTSDALVPRATRSFTSEAL